MTVRAYRYLADYAQVLSDIPSDPRSVEVMRDGELEISSATPAWKTSSAAWMSSPSGWLWPGHHRSGRDRHSGGDLGEDGPTWPDLSLGLPGFATHVSGCG